MDCLLRAAASLTLLECRDSDRYGLGPLGAALVDNPGVTAMVRHHRLLYRDLSDPLALLRGEIGETQLQRYWAYATASDPSASDPAAVADYSRLMAASQPMIAEEVLSAKPFRPGDRVLDVGGGEGAFLSALARAYPDLDLALFDLPAVTERARETLAAQGLGDRVVLHGGSFLSDPLPSGATAITLVRILHDHDDAPVRRLLHAARQALPPGGRLIVAEPMADTPGAEPIGAAYFGFYLRAMGSGRPRSEQELRDMLREAGFGSLRSLKTRTPLLVRVLVAETST